MKCLLFFSLLLLSWHSPPREDQLSKLNSFDLVVIGGGATGAGIALEATARGHSVLLVDRGDFACETSSKSTKLVHGGVRYLEKAIKNRDKQQYELVTEALQERGNLFEMAPYAVRPIAIVTPIYKMSEVPYMWLGLKIYDWIAKEARIDKSRFLSASKVKEQFPYIKKKGLKGGVLYYDGQFNDTRLNIATILTAVEMGAVALNYMEMVELIKDEEQVCGVELQDKLTNQKYFVQADVVINATGPFSDHIREMDGALVPRIRPSSGTHIVIDRKYTGPSQGILIPKTEDGRLLFFLPWQGMTVAGTTDHPTDVCEKPLPHKDDVDYILAHINRYLEEEVTEIYSVWTGLRPLVMNPTEESTQNICRSHQIEVSNSGLISVLGGKWTTFRKMAEDAVDRAFGEANRGQKIQLVGSEGYDETAISRLHTETGIDIDTCDRLIQSYGMRAFEVVKLSENLQTARVLWACREEYARTIMDVMSRRHRLAFLNADQADLLIESVADVMQSEFRWSEEEKIRQISEARSELKRFRPGFSRESV